MPWAEGLENEVYLSTIGKVVRFPAGVGEAEAFADLERDYPEVFEKPSGFIAGAISGYENLKGNVSAIPSAVSGALGNESDLREAGNIYDESRARMEEALPDGGPNWREIPEKFEEEGVLGGLGFVKDVATTGIGTQVPNLALSGAAGKIGASRPVVAAGVSAAARIGSALGMTSRALMAVPPVGPGGIAAKVTGGILGVASLLPVMFGENLNRNYENGRSDGSAVTPDEMRLWQAAAAAGPSAAMEYVFVGLMGGIGRGPQTAAAQVLKDSLAATTTKVGKQALSQNAGRGVGRSVLESLTEFPTELSQTIISRAQAGESISIDDAEFIREMQDTVAMTIPVVGAFGPVGAYRSHRANKKAEENWEKLSDEERRLRKGQDDRREKAKDADLARAKRIQFDNERRWIDANLEADNNNDIIKKAALRAAEDTPVEISDVIEAADSRNILTETTGFKAFVLSMTGGRTGSLRNTDNTERRRIRSVLSGLKIQEYLTKDGGAFMPEFTEAQFEAVVRKTRKSKEITNDSVRKILGSGALDIDKKVASSIIKAMKTRGYAAEVKQKNGKRPTKPRRTGYTEANYQKVLDIGQENGRITQADFEGATNTYGSEPYQSFISDMRNRGDLPKKDITKGVFIPDTYNSIQWSKDPKEDRTLSVGTYDVTSEASEGYFVRGDDKRATAGAVKRSDAIDTAKMLEERGKTFSIKENGQVIKTYKQKGSANRAMADMRERFPQSRFEVVDNAFEKFTVDRKKSEGWATIERVRSGITEGKGQSVGVLDYGFSPTREISESLRDQRILELTMPGTSEWDVRSKAVKDRSKAKLEEFLRNSGARLDPTPRENFTTIDEQASASEERKIERRRLGIGSDGNVRSIGVFPNDKFLLAELEKGLVAAGLSNDVAAKIVSVDPQTAGFYDPFMGGVRTIAFNLDTYPVRNAKTSEEVSIAVRDTVNHESIHAMYELDLFTENERKALENSASRVLMDDGRTFTEWAQEEYDGIPGYETQEAKREEAVAEMYSQFYSNPKVRNQIAGQPRTLIERIQRFLEKFVNAMNGVGFGNAADVIAGIDIVKGRKRNEVRTLKDQRAARGGDARKAGGDRESADIAKELVERQRGTRDRVGDLEESNVDPESTGDGTIPLTRPGLRLSRVEDSEAPAPRFRLKSDAIEDTEVVWSSEAVYRSGQAAADFEGKRGGVRGNPFDAEEGFILEMDPTGFREDLRYLDDNMSTPEALVVRGNARNVKTIYYNQDFWRGGNFEELQKLHKAFPEADVAYIKIDLETENVMYDAPSGDDLDLIDQINRASMGDTLVVSAAVIKARNPKTGETVLVDGDTHADAVDKANGMGLVASLRGIGEGEGGLFRLSNGELSSRQEVEISVGSQLAEKAVGRSFEDVWIQAPAPQELTPSQALASFDVPEWKPTQVFNVNKINNTFNGPGVIGVEVIRNPSYSDIRQLSNEFRDDFPQAPRGTTKIRGTEDDAGNKYVWRADKAVHADIEPSLMKIEETPVGQNMTTREDNALYMINLGIGVKARLDILAETPGFVPRFSQGATRKANQEIMDTISRPIARGETEGRKLSLSHEARLDSNQDGSRDLGDAEYEAIRGVFSPPMAHKSLWETLKMMIANKPLDWFKQKMIDKYRGIEIVVQKARAERERRNPGSSDSWLLAGVDALKAAYMSDKGKGLAMESITNGQIVYRDGITVVDTTKKGLVDILQPIYDLGPAVLRDWHLWMMARREARFETEGRMVALTPQERQKIFDTARENNWTEIFEAVNEEYQEWNGASVQYMVDTGLLSPELAKIYTKYGDYIAFYRETEGEANARLENFIGEEIDQMVADGVIPPISNEERSRMPSSMFGSLTGQKTGPRAKGGTSMVVDPLTGMIKNLEAAIIGGLKNVAATRVMDDAILVNMAQPGTKESHTHTVRSNGKDEYFTVTDALLHDSLNGMTDGHIKYLNFFAAPASFLREMVTRSPDYIMKNLMRDSMSAWVTAGVSTPVDTMQAFFGGKQESYDALKGAGLLTGFDNGRNVKDIAKKINSRLEGGSKGKIPFWSSAVKVWDWAGDVSSKSDAATRQSVYEAVLEDLLSKGFSLGQAQGEAIFQAAEVINFSRRGNSGLAKIITSVIPFLNARVQGLDLLWRAGKGQYSTKIDEASRSRALISFLSRASLLATTSLMYAGMVEDDEEYKKATSDERDNNWLLPGFGGSPGLKIPVPFEVGFLFKTIPERLYHYTSGDQDAKQTMDAINRGIISNLEMNPFGVQATKGPLEVLMNHSFYTGREIVPWYLADGKAELQVRPSTNKLAEGIATAFNVSPMKTEHILKSYVGTIGTHILTVADWSIRQAPGIPSRPTLRADQWALARGFLQGQEGSEALMADFYALRRDTRAIMASFRAAKKGGDMKEARKIYEEYGGVIRVNDSINAVNNEFTKMRSYQKKIELDPSISPDEKAEIAKSLDDRRNAYRDRVKLLRDTADLPAELLFPFSVLKRN